MPSPASAGHPVKPPTHLVLVQTFYFPAAHAAQPAWGWVCPLEVTPGGLCNHPLGDPESHRDQDSTTDSIELYIELSGQKATMYPKMDTTPPSHCHPPPNQFPKPRYVARVTVTWSSTKPVGAGDETPPPHHTRAPPRPLSAGERLAPKKPKAESRR